VVSIGIAYAALFMYCTDKASSEEVFMENDEALVWLSAVVGTVVLLFACFLRLMKEEYRWTFFSTETGNEYAQNYFLEGETDERKMNIIGTNRHLWEEIRCQVGDFVKANWAKWEEDEPAWFDEQFNHSVDDDLLPAVVVTAKVKCGGGKKRRGSLREALGVAGGVAARGEVVAVTAIKDNQVAPEIVNEEHLM
jgi:hypothetical protein